MDKSEPALVPEWLRGTSGGTNGGGNSLHHIASLSQSGMKFMFLNVPQFAVCELHVRCVEFMPFFFSFSFSPILQMIILRPILREARLTSKMAATVLVPQTENLLTFEEALVVMAPY